MAGTLNPKHYSRPVTYYKKLATTVMTEMYTVPQFYSSYLQCVHVCNEGASTVNFTLELVDASPSQTVSIYKNVIIPGKGYLTVDTLHLYLAKGDILQVKAETAAKLSIALSFDEHYDPNSTSII